MLLQNQQMLHILQGQMAHRKQRCSEGCKPSSSELPRVGSQAGLGSSRVAGSHISWLCRQAWPDLAGEEGCGCKHCSSLGPSKPESQQLLSSREAAHPACGWAAFWLIWEEQSHVSNAGARGCGMRVTEQHSRPLQQTRRL